MMMSTDLNYVSKTKPQLQLLCRRLNNINGIFDNFL